MKTQSRDTSPEAERVQFELLRKASPAQRMSLVRSLTCTTVQLSRRALRRAHPEMDEEEVALTWIALHYSPDLADRVRADLARRRDGYP